MAAFTDELVAVFPHWNDEGDSRDCFCADFAELGADAAEAQFAQAEEILEGLLHSAESISVSLCVTLSEAKSRARQARAVAEKHAGGGAGPKVPKGVPARE